MRKKVYRNRDVKRIIIGAPAGHLHIRARLEFSDDEVLVLQEATIASIVRAFVNVKMHPKRHVIELKSQKVEGKAGYAKYQLLDTSRAENEVLEDLEL